MKIIQLSTFFHPSVGGIERQVEEISTHLLEIGTEVQVFTTDATHGKESRMLRLDDKFRGVPVFRFKYVLAFGDFFRLAPGLVWKLFTTDYDVLHVHNTHDAHLLPAIVIKTLRRKKLVLTGHNPYVVGVQKRREHISVGVRVFELCLRIFSGGIDRYIALLESEKLAVTRILGIKPEKITVIPNGIEDIFYSEGGDAEHFYKEWNIDPTKWDLIVGTVSRLNLVKGIQFLAQAAKDLNKVLFVLAGGDDGYYDTLKRIYRDNENVVFTAQYIPSGEVRNFYQAIDVFLLPSIYEPFGMTMVEAMAQSKMVIATNVGGPQEILSPAFGELVIPDDQQTWFERIRYYSQHRDEAKQKGESARKAAGKYQWKNIIKQLQTVYSELSV
jgi:glycosyltransferase involved in cell wall biosynthesis